jgi:DNA-binding transcriptional LysR family regulator
MVGRDIDRLISTAFCCRKRNTAFAIVPEANHGSERLHVSLSAISRQIAKLEHELRAPIFDRRAQGMTLTPAGEILHSKIEGVMREFARVYAWRAGVRRGSVGILRLHAQRPFGVAGS